MTVDTDIESARLENLYTAPGTLVVAADAQPTTVVATDYSADHLRQFTVTEPETLQSLAATPSVTWIDVQGLGSQNLLERIGQTFDLHPLALADIVNVPQRSRLEEYPSHYLAILQAVVPIGDRFGSEQIAIVIGKTYVLTFQEAPEIDCFQSVRDRLQHNRGTIRHQGADYLAYSLWDAIVDGFFPILDTYGDRLEELEEALTDSPSRQFLSDIHQLKRDLLRLYNIIWHQRDTLACIIRVSNEVLTPTVQPYWRDCFDHVVQVTEQSTFYREIAVGLVDLYLSAASHRMNEVITLLTVVSAIFIPLTFVVGVYGMNFDVAASPLNMPELEWYWGYPMVWLLMLSIASGMLLAFWRKGWLGGKEIL